MKKRSGQFSIYIVLLLVIMLILYAVKLTTSTPDGNTFEYSDLIAKINNNEIKKVEVIRDADVSNAGTVNAQLLDDTIKTVKIVDVTGFMTFAETKVGDGLEIVTGLPASSFFSTIIIYVVLMFVAVFVMFFLMQNLQGGGGNKVMSFGKSRAKVNTDDKKKITFENVAGLKEERGELEEIVDFLKFPTKYVEIGARIPKGILLVGPPGTGKTLLARAVSGEAGVPFFSISGSDFVEMFVGVGASRVRDLFEQAKKNLPCLIFIDEIDAVGRKRGAGLGGGHDEREQTLNQLLVEMDGFGVNEGVIILAATNRSDILDPALLRPGRFDRKIMVGYPDSRGREDILTIHSKGKILAKDVNLGVLAKSTPGFTGADLENLMNESALLAAREDKKEITMEEIRKALIKVSIGTEKKSRVIKDKERKLTAYHEIGHALCHELLSELEPVHIVSVIPTGSAGGYTMHLPEDDKMYLMKKFMEQSIVSLLGGRAAEEVILGDISTGASNDIERATAMARGMVTKYGMSEILGPIQFGNENEDVFIGRDLAHARNYGEQVAGTIDDEIKRIVTCAYEEAKKIINENLDNIQKIAIILIEKERITGDEFRELLGLEPIVYENTDVKKFLTGNPDNETSKKVKEEEKVEIPESKELNSKELKSDDLNSKEPESK